MVASVLIALLFSAAGMGAFAYGRKTDTIVPKIGGVVLMFYPYVVPNPVLMAAAGIVLSAAIYVFRDL